MDRTIELLVELHQGLDRLGPGAAECSLRALTSCTELPSDPSVLDVGCGTGAQTLTLASAVGGRILAVDLILDFLVRLAKRTVKVEKRVQPLAADMNRLPFADASFDLIWSEGAAYSMGFVNALAAWRNLARPRGYLVVTELSWFRPDASPEAREYWDQNYPGMRSVEDNLAAANAAGWEAVDNFHLPAETWGNYHEPLQERLAAFRQTHAGDPQALAVADLTEQEISIMRRYGHLCGYELFILQRGA